MKKHEEEQLTAEILKEKGNKAVQENNFKEAILHYTHAIKLEPQNCALYSNRSFAYLKLEQYYLALCDAKETITLHPMWAKGHFRKGEVEFATEHYSRAYDSYKAAFMWKPDDPDIMKAVENAANRMLKQKAQEKQIPWVGAGVGIVVGAFFMIAEFLTTSSPTHPFLMAFITMATSLVGYIIARFYKLQVVSSRKAKLAPPQDTEQDNSKEDDEKEARTRKPPRYTRSQARMRYKQGKL